MAEEYQQTIATAQGDGKVVGEDVVDLKGKEDDQKFHDEIIGYEKVDVQDVQAMTKVGEGEKLGCDTSSSGSKSGSDSGSDSKSDSVSSKSNSVSSKSNSDSSSKSGSNSGTSTLKEKKRLKRRVQKVKLSKKLAEKGEEKIGMVTEMDVNKDGAEGTKLLEEGDDKLQDKLQCDSSDSGSKSGSDSNSKTGSDSGSKSGSDSVSKSGSSTINTKAKRSIRKGLKEKIKEQTSMKIVIEDKKNDPLISLEAKKSDDKETKWWRKVMRISNKVCLNVKALTLAQNLALTLALILGLTLLLIWLGGGHGSYSGEVGRANEDGGIP